MDGQPTRPTKLFLGGLTRNTTTKQLRDHFIQYGRVLDCVAMRHPDGRPRGFGYVTLDSPAAAERCLAEPQVIDGRVIDMKKAVPGTSGAGSPTSAGGAQQHSGTPKFGRGARGAGAPGFFPVSGWDMGAMMGGYPTSPHAHAHSPTAAAAAWASWAAMGASSPMASSPEALLAAAGFGFDDAATPIMTPAARVQRRTAAAPSSIDRQGTSPASIGGSSPQKVALPSAVRSHKSVLAESPIKEPTPWMMASPVRGSKSRPAVGKENMSPKSPQIKNGVADAMSASSFLALPPGLFSPPPPAAQRSSGRGISASPLKLDLPFQLGGVAATLGGA